MLFVGGFNEHCECRVAFDCRFTERNGYLPPVASILNESRVSFLAMNAAAPKRMAARTIAAKSRRIMLSDC